MKVTKQNYERYLIDFMDGTLDPSLKEDLLAFLDANPDIKEEFEGLEMVSLEMEENVSFDAKEGLKQAQISATENINESNYEGVFVASVENDLTDSEARELDTFLDKNPSLASSQELYEKTKVYADTSITYPDKKKLKKYPLYQRKAWLYSASAAASIILLFGLFGLLNNQNQVQNNFADNTNIEKLITLPSLAAVNIEINVELTIVEEVKSYQIASVNEADLFLLSDEKIQQLKSRINPKQHLASLELDSRERLDIVSFKNLHDLNLEKFSRIKYASTEPLNKNKAIAKAIWGGLFGKLKNKKRIAEGGKEDQNVSRVKPLWVLASIGLERVNEVTGSNMRIRAKGGEAKHALNNEYIEEEGAILSK